MDGDAEGSDGVGGRRVACRRAEAAATHAKGHRPPRVMEEAARVEAHAHPQRHTPACYRPSTQ